ncbi:MAG: CpaF family protein [Lachnospiraceae bacterium]|nr:CpaF family protein [Lachnospiraceae bacterium]
MRDAESLKKRLREDIVRNLDMSKELTDEELLRKIDSETAYKTGAVTLSVSERMTFRKELFDSFRRLDILQELIEDEDITEIMVNGVSAIFYEKKGRIKKWDRCFSSREKLEDVIQQIVSKVNRAVNTSSPIVDARLEDGSRVNVVLPPAAPDGPIVTIRKFSKTPMRMSDLIENNSINKEAADFLATAVGTGRSIFVSGGTGSGKTTFLNALSEFIPKGERVVTIEDSMELQLTIENLVRLETRNESAMGGGEITIRDLIRAALRMRPDRIIVGEVRGAEALDMLQAMNTGHDGSMSTGHANSPADMLSRLETMVLMGSDLPLAAIRSQIGSAIDFIIQLSRFSDGSRKVVSIDEVMGYKQNEIELREIFVRGKEGLIRV